MLAVAITVVFPFEELVSISRTELGLLTITGIVGFAVGRGLTFLGIKHIGASRSTTVYASYPLFTMALAIPFLGERVSAALVAGVLLIIGGVTLLLIERDAEKMIASGANRMLGYAYSLGSAVAFGSNTVLIKFLVSGRVHPMVTVTVALFFGVVTLMAVAGRGLGAGFRVNPRSTAFLALSGVSSTLGAMALYYGLRIAPAVVITPLGSTSPLFTLLGTYLFLRKLEKVTYYVVLGCLMVVAGGTLVSIS